jgi:hypothetical protein
MMSLTTVSLNQTHPQIESWWFESELIPLEGLKLSVD